MMIEQETINKMNLANRSHELHKVIASCVCTDHFGSELNTETAIEKIRQLLEQMRLSKNNVYIIGNGGSAAVASHAITDFVNVCKLSAHTLHEPAIMTCMSNDYGYENAFARVVENSLRKDDLLIAISSSGKSANICNAVKKAKELGAHVLTLSGFAHDNPLRSLGEFNFWLQSKDYGFVEIGHLFILHNIADRFGVMS